MIINLIECRIKRTKALSLILGIIPLSLKLKNGGIIGEKGKWTLVCSWVSGPKGARGKGEEEKGRVKSLIFHMAFVLFMPPCTLL